MIAPARLTHAILDDAPPCVAAAGVLHVGLRTTFSLTEPLYNAERFLIFAPLLDLAADYKGRVIMVGDSAAFTCQELPSKKAIDDLTAVLEHATCFGSLNFVMHTGTLATDQHFDIVNEMLATLDEMDPLEERGTIAIAGDAIGHIPTLTIAPNLDALCSPEGLLALRQSLEARTTARDQLAQVVDVLRRARALPTTQDWPLALITAIERLEALAKAEYASTQTATTRGIMQYAEALKAMTSRSRILPHSETASGSAVHGYHPGYRELIVGLRARTEHGLVEASLHDPSYLDHVPTWNNEATITYRKGGLANVEEFGY